MKRICKTNVLSQIYFLLHDVFFNSDRINILPSLLNLFELLMTSNFERINFQIKVEIVFVPNLDNLLLEKYFSLRDLIYFINNVSVCDILMLLTYFKFFFT